jgi:hypothetical protein
MPPAIVNTHLDKEAAALIGTVVEVDTAFVAPALGQVGAVPKYSGQLHDGQEQAEGVETYVSKLTNCAKKRSWSLDQLSHCAVKFTIC